MKYYIVIHSGMNKKLSLTINVYFFIVTVFVIYYLLTKTIIELITVWPYNFKKESTLRYSKFLYVQRCLN